MNIGQLLIQVFPYKFRVLQEVQLVKVFTQVEHSPSHGTAIPEIFRYPSGVADRHLLLSKTNPGSHERQIVGLEQFRQPMFKRLHDKQL